MSSRSGGRSNGAGTKIRRYARACVDSTGGNPLGRGFVALVAALIVVSTVAPFAAGVVEAAPGGNGNGGPPDWAGPPSHVVDDLPENSRHGNVSASDFKSIRLSSHPSSTSVRLTTTDKGEFAIAFTDDTNAAGRKARIPVAALKAALGSVPSGALVTNSETGETKAVPLTRTGKFVVLEFDHFSTNTVTFSGSVRLQGDPAVDGTRYTYNITDLDAVSDYSITATGHTVEEWDNFTGQGGDGATFDISFAGNADPRGPSSNGEPVVVFTGQESTSTFSASGTDTADGYTTSVVVDGTESPRNPTVTFTGRRTLTAASKSGTDATSSTSTTVDVAGNVAPLNQEVTFTGRETTTARTIDANAKANGETISYDVGGNIDATGAEVTFIGRGGSNPTTYSGTGVGPDSSHALDIDGNLDPTGESLSVTMDTGGPFSYNPVTAHGDGTTESYTDGPDFIGSHSTDGKISSEVRIEPTTTGKVTDATVDINFVTGSRNGMTFDVYLVEGAPDGTLAEGTLVKSGWAPSWSEGTKTITFDTAESVTQGQTYTLAFVTDSYTGNSDFLKLAVDTSASTTWVKSTTDGDHSSYPDVGLTITSHPTVTVSDGDGRTKDLGTFSDGESKTVSWDLATTSTTLDFSTTGEASSLDYTLDVTEESGSENPSIDVDGDGDTDASHSGVLTSGQTATYSVANLAPGSKTATVGLDGYEVDVDISFTETDATENPKLDVDDDGTYEVSHSGILTSGQTATYSLTSLSEGTQGLGFSTAGEEGVDWELTYDERTVTENPAVDVGNDGTIDATYSGTLLQGETATKELSTLSKGTNDLAFSSATHTFDWNVSATEVYHTDDPSLDLNNDGSYEVSHVGTLGPGETATYELSELSTTDSSFALSTNSGTETDVEIRAQEVVKSRDVQVTVGGNTTSYSGTLDDGETVNLSTNTAWVKSGENVVDVSVGTGTLSADAPTPAVGLTYEHTAVDEHTVDYEGETWSERYNASRTWGADTENATLTIPFNGNVVEIRDLQVTTNGSPTSTHSYSLNETTLVVEFGDVAEGTTKNVSVTGSKVVVEGGEIDVVRPTVEGNTLDTRFQVTNRTDELAIDVSGTSSSTWVHYADNASWANKSAYAHIQAGGNQKLVLPQANEGGEATVRTIPLSAAPDNDVVVEVEKTDPIRLVTRPGDTPSDSVTYTYHDVVSGESYELVSITNDVLLDSAEADSSVDLLDPADDSETIEIREANSTTSTGGGGGAGSGLPPLGVGGSDSEPLTNPILLLVAVVALLGGLTVIARRRGLPVTAVVGIGTVVFAIAIETLSPGTVSGAVSWGLATALERLGRVAPAVGLTAAFAFAYVVWKAANRYLRRPSIQVVGRIQK